MPKVWTVSIDEVLEIAKALSNETRLEIFKQIQRSHAMNVNEIAALFGLPSSTATVSIKKLEDAGLIRSDIVPGSRGTQKICSPRYDRLLVDLSAKPEDHPPGSIVIPMPVGTFSECEVAPTCGLLAADGIIGYLDDPRSFYEPDRIRAGMLWFSKGYVEYRFPNKLPYDCTLASLELSMEICSEAPMHREHWPSDITLWINGVEIGSWLSPGDFGGSRGHLTPDWWDTSNTQFGLLKKWRVTASGSYVDGERVSGVTASELGITRDLSGFAVRIGVKDDAPNQGGLNLFGAGFGNYEQDLVLKLQVEPAK